MTLQEYRTHTIRTLPDLGDKIRLASGILVTIEGNELIDTNALKLNLSHMLLGLNSEIKELVECVGTNLKVSSKVDLVNLGEELGDLYWYIANYANLRRVPLPDEVDMQDLVEEQCLDHLIDNVGELTDVVKRFVAYNKAIDRTKEIDAVYGICQALRLFEDTYGIEGNHIRLRNINKLRARYPEKFSDDLAVNRDIEKERKELEG